MFSPSSWIRFGLHLFKLLTIPFQRDANARAKASINVITRFIPLTKGEPNQVLLGYKSACLVPRNKTHQGAAQPWVISLFSSLQLFPRSLNLHCDRLSSLSVRWRGLARCTRRRRARTGHITVSPGKAKLGQTSAIFLCHLPHRWLGSVFVSQLFCKMRFVDW